MSFDISHLLEKWDYEPGRLTVRRFQARDGSEKIQLRLDLGLLQMNAAGRPDGKRPYGKESLLDHFRQQLDKHRETHHGNDDGFALTADDCARLQQELVQYHHRYICLFQLGDFEAVLRDTERNRTALDFVAKYAASDEYTIGLRQFVPQLLMMQTRARGTIALEKGDHPAAFKCVESGLEALRRFFRDQGHPESIEDSAELRSLEGWLEEIRTNRPLSERERLENALHEAVAREDYEKAAQVRDALRNLGSGANQ